MGLFDFISNKAQQMRDAILQYEQEADYWDPQIICDKLKNASKHAERAGYSNALRKKSREMSEYELKNIFDYAYRSANSWACNALYKTMEDHELAYKDEDGKIHRTYTSY